MKRWSAYVYGLCHRAVDESDQFWNEFCAVWVACITRNMCVFFHHSSKRLDRSFVSLHWQKCVQFFFLLYFLSVPELFQRQHWGNSRDKLWKTYVYGLSRAHGYHLELNWTELNWTAWRFGSVIACTVVVCRRVLSLLLMFRVFSPLVSWPCAALRFNSGFSPTILKLGVTAMKRKWIAEGAAWETIGYVGRRSITLSLEEAKLLAWHWTWGVRYHAWTLVCEFWGGRSVESLLVSLSLLLCVLF